MARGWPSTRAPSRSANYKSLHLGRAPYVLYGVKYIDLVTLMTHHVDFCDAEQHEPEARQLQQPPQPVQQEPATLNSLRGQRPRHAAGHLP